MPGIRGVFARLFGDEPRIAEASGGIRSSQNTGDADGHSGNCFIDVDLHCPFTISLETCIFPQFYPLLAMRVSALLS